MKFKYTDVFLLFQTNQKTLYCIRVFNFTPSLLTFLQSLSVLKNRHRKYFWDKVWVGTPNGISAHPIEAEW